MAKVARHVFVCVNRRPGGGRRACGSEGGEAVANALRTELAARPALWGEVAVTGCECLGPCFDGPNVVVYPEGVWYSGVGTGDVGDIVEQHLVGGTVVKRLLLPDPDADDDVAGDDDRGE